MRETVTMRPSFAFHFNRSGVRLALAAAIVMTASVALACSTVALGSGDRRLIAYSYDTSATGAGLVFVNPAGAGRRSIMEGEAAAWTTGHGSVSFNQFGLGMPAAGMNTAGLVVSLMWNDDAVYPLAGERPTVNELEFIQRLLDRAGTVDEAIAMLDGVAISGLVPIHFFVADAQGATAAITPTAEGFVVHAGQDMPVPALTNTSYAALVAQLAGFEGFGGARPVPGRAGTDDPDSLTRFAIAARAAAAPATPVLNDAWDVLGGVENRQSRWQIVFMPAARRIVLRRVGADGQWRIDLDTLDFSCRDLPLGRPIDGLSPDETIARLSPVDPVAMTGVLTEVFAGFEATTGLPPEAAGAVVAAQRDALDCGDRDR